MSKTWEFWVVRTINDQYWTGQKIGVDATFSDHIEDAIKFASKASAQTAQYHLLQPIARFIESHNIVVLGDCEVAKELKER